MAFPIKAVGEAMLVWLRDVRTGGSGHRAGSMAALPHRGQFAGQLDQADRLDAGPEGKPLVAAVERFS